MGKLATSPNARTRGRLLESGASVFTPASISGLWGWWDASDTATITHSSNAVSQWDDKSGNARNLVQATAAAKPTTNTRTQNSLNVLDFDGGDYLHLTASIGLTLTSFSWFGVWGEDTQVSTAGFMTVHNGSGNDYDNANSFTVESGNSTQRIDFAHNNSFAVFTTPPNTPTQLDVYTGIKASGTPTVWTKTPAASTSGSNVGGTGTANGGVLIGARYSSGSIPSGQRPDGPICECGIYSTDISTGDRTLLETYLGTKWGL